MHKTSWVYVCRVPVGKQSAQRCDALVATRTTRALHSDYPSENILGHHSVSMDAAIAALHKKSTALRLAQPGRDRLHTNKNNNKKLVEHRCQAGLREPRLACRLAASSHMGLIPSLNTL